MNSLHILVVEDEPILREDVATYLRDYGCTVHEADSAESRYHVQNGAAGGRLIHRHQPERDCRGLAARETLSHCASRRRNHIRIRQFNRSIRVYSRQCIFHEALRAARYSGSMSSSDIQVSVTDLTLQSSAELNSSQESHFEAVVPAALIGRVAAVAKSKYQQKSLLSGTVQCYTWFSSKGSRAEKS
jgi:CheY-like chemotaxis protein